MLFTQDAWPGIGVESQLIEREALRLGALGLTESLRVGYRLSPRGSALAMRLEGGSRAR